MILQSESHSKVTADHLRRDAYLYIRQSTLQQVFENRESTERQYALKHRALALGWPLQRVTVIDCDLGHSAASAADREGFRKLVAEVGIGKAGIVMGLEVSRLARNSTDWHRLLEICALTDTLILDEDGLYNPQHFNDRLLLGLKGTMSEAELHFLRARLQGGILSKAERGELRCPLPVGLVYDAQGKVALDPDQQVQESIRLFFQTFRRIGTASGTVRFFRRQDLRFPRRLRTGVRKGELLWAELRFSRALQMLHNPRYAGTFVFGRTKSRKTAEGKVLTKKLPQEEWPILLPDIHPGYISWEEYEDHQRRLRESAQAHGIDRRSSPPREGPALLQGLLLCGRCGQKMTVRYVHRMTGSIPEYVCQRSGIERGEPICQRILGAELDQAVGKLVVEALTPVALEVALTVQQELQSRLDEADRLRRKQVERVRYEAELAQRRYLQVDPDNRLVADTLEADWNEKLRALETAQEECEQACLADRAQLTKEQQEKILALATDFPKLWGDAKTPSREKKRMLRLLIEDVTLIRDKQLTAHLRFKGGVAKTLTLPLPIPSWKTWRTPPKVVAEIDRLLDAHSDEQIAEILNQQGLRAGKGGPFHRIAISRLRRSHGLKSRYDRLREKGLLTLVEMAEKLEIDPCTVRIWARRGILQAHPYNAKNGCLYETIGENPPTKMQGRKLAERQKDLKVLSNQTKEVQCEA